LSSRPELSLIHDLPIQPLLISQRLENGLHTTCKLHRHHDFPPRHAHITKSRTLMTYRSHTDRQMHRTRIQLFYILVGLLGFFILISAFSWWRGRKRRQATIAEVSSSILSGLASYPRLSRVDARGMSCCDTERVADYWLSPFPLASTLFGPNRLALHRPDD
jgi:hypothetical protein